MGEYDFEPTHLQEILAEMGLALSFSNVKYGETASAVGLDPFHRFSDMENFELHRSRIPDALLKDIVQDMDTMLSVYGPRDEDTAD